jgi:2-isopropylmalate synthase
VEHQLSGTGNGALSSLVDALRGLGIELDVVDYNEHTIGTSKDAKAATYIGCTASASSVKVWGVGIHQDVVQASLIALLSAASSVSQPGRQPVSKRPSGYGSVLSAMANLRNSS